ncbi:MAG: protein translocase subunit SecF [Candidatus Babeliales bacterium]
MIDFLKYRIVTALISAFIIFGSVGLYFYKMHTRGYAFAYSIDFTGGTQVHMRFEKPISVAQLKDVLENHGWSNAVVREFSSTEVLIRVKEFASDAQGLADRMREAIVHDLPDNTVTVLQSEAVGAGVGAELRWKSARAVLVGLIAMLMYIAVTFWSTAFALGAIVSLIHDVIVMLAMFLILDKEISINVIGAVLTVIGYSMNDTIVVFARIRSMLKTMSNAPLYDIVNTSINTTLRRTILTSFATTLTVLSMLILGGEALRDFALALLIGIVFGTYSSIYIASPVMMLLYKNKKA